MGDCCNEKKRPAFSEMKSDKEIKGKKGRQIRKP
jgi:hypothetical protein